MGIADGHDVTGLPGRLGEQLTQQRQDGSHRAACARISQIVHREHRRDLGHFWIHPGGSAPVPRIGDQRPDPRERAGPLQERVPRPGHGRGTDPGILSAGECGLAGGR